MIAVALCGGVAVGEQASPQDASPVFRLQVDAVEIDASVSDANGNPVTDLTPEDFEVFEDGVPQTITSLSLVNIPAERLERAPGSAAPVESDVQTNTQPERHLYMIVLDIVPADLALRARHMMRRFIEQYLSGNDLAAIASIGPGNVSRQEFTSSRRLLLEALDRFSGESGDVTLSSELESRTRARAFRELVEFMGRVRGRRKTMLLVTRGIGDVYEALDYSGGSRSLAFQDMHGALTAATRGNVSIYPLDPAGLTPEPSALRGLGERSSPPDPAIARSLRLADMVRALDLRALAAATGGTALVNSNNFDAAFERIVRENSTYYVLGFTSTNDRRDGRYRRLQVRVSRPGLRVRARDGYLAPLAGTTERAIVAGGTDVSPAVAEALRLPLPSPDVPMRMFAAPYRASARNANVALAIEMDASRLELVQKGDSINGVVDVTIAAVDANGRRRAGEQYRVTLALKPYTYARAEASGLRVLSEVVLPPGRYQLRAAAGNVTSGTAGSVRHELEVPDFRSGSLAMSGVTLTSESSADVVTSALRRPLGDILPAPPTASREFPSGDRLTLYVEVYDNRRGRTTPPLEVRAELRAEDGRVLKAVAQQRSSADLRLTTGVFAFLAEVPLDVAPGSYVVQVEARPITADKPTVRRAIPIKVK